MVSWALIFAIASPLLFGFMDILDKYIVVHKVKKPLGFAVNAALVNMLFGIILALSIGWDGISMTDLIYPAITGTIAGAMFYLTYVVVQKEDASHITGLVYTYPVIVALLSIFILNERLSILGYLGFFMVLAGILTISIRLKQIKLKTSLWLILTLILVTAIWEFLIKVLTNHVPVWNGFAISSIFNGIVAFAVILFFRNVRKDFVSEIKTFNWAFLTEMFTIFGSLALYFAMAGLQATVVSSIAAIQPLAVLFYERIVDGIFGKMSRDHLLLPKLGAILLIVIGVVLLSIAGA